MKILLPSLRFNCSAEVALSRDALMLSEDAWYSGVCSYGTGEMCGIHKTLPITTILAQYMKPLQAQHTLCSCQASNRAFSVEYVLLTDAVGRTESEPKNAYTTRLVRFRTHANSGTK